MSAMLGGISPMSKHLKWTDRSFQFTFPVEVYPEMIERMRGTPARLEDRLKSLATNILTRRDGEALVDSGKRRTSADLESLVQQSIDEYLAGAKSSSCGRHVESQNPRSRSNELAMSIILSDFREQRMHLVDRLDNLNPPAFRPVRASSAAGRFDAPGGLRLSQKRSTDADRENHLVGSAIRCDLLRGARFVCRLMK